MNKTHITPSTPTHKAIQSPKQSDYHKIFSTRLFYCFIRESFFTLPKPVLTVMLMCGQGYL